MKHDIVLGLCRNCGAAGPEGDCPAEATIDELLQMERGEIPRRAVRVTWHQSQVMVGRDPRQLSDSEIAGLLPDLRDDPTLIGNVIAELTEEFGIPPCNGCSGRQAWLNRAHLRAREIIARLRGHSPSIRASSN
jgi:hypothetical protein